MNIKLWATFLLDRLHFTLYVGVRPLIDGLRTLASRSRKKGHIALPGSNFHENILGPRKLGAFEPKICEVWLVYHENPQITYFMFYLKRGK